MWLATAIDELWTDTWRESDKDKKPDNKGRLQQSQANKDATAHNKGGI